MMRLRVKYRTKILKSSIRKKICQKSEDTKEIKIENTFKEGGFPPLNCILAQYAIALKNFLDGRKCV